MDRDLILDGSYTPTYEEISDYIENPMQMLWRDFNSYIQREYKAAPKIMYSKCSGKPGWNVKYQKSGKSLCTLYPEKDGFIALVVVKTDLKPIIEGMSSEFEPIILELVSSARPFNGTLWLMIPVKDSAILDNIKQLFLLKQEVNF
jgi:hypothetical protein